ncbi:VOC family protein [Gracilimonas sp.]|uniref:VOC family protein n=1 Tax=Gracilimonas sp. TaxID=1974203 RepID=UPI0032EE2434
MIRLLFLFVFALFTSHLSLAQTGPNVEKSKSFEQSNDSSQNFHPQLLAISVKNLDASVKWYADVLGFTKIENYDFPDDQMRLSFMERNGFELELIEIADTPSFSAPNPENPATRRGLVKFAFYSDVIDSLYASAVKAEAKVQSSIRNSNRTGGRFFILLDPDGNWVQVFGPAE